MRVYDSRIGRWLSTDPKPKYHESLYAWNSNNPVWIIDPDGSDSIFYNQKGKEINRISMKGNHTYWLQHANGNRIIGGQRFFEGNSYYSFFGDPEKFAEPTLFTEFREVGTQDIINAVDKQVDRYGKGVSPGSPEAFKLLWKKSPHHQPFDYKNSVLDDDGNIEIESNLRTAYTYNGILYNRNEIGNVYWGATAYRLGMSRAGAVTGLSLAHYKNEGNGEEVNELMAVKFGFFVYSYNKPLCELNCGRPIYYIPSEDAFRSPILNMKYRGADPFSKDAANYKYSGKIKY